MKYKTIVAILDGVPDQTGDILSKNVILPNDYIKVTNNFQENSLLGRALVKMEGDNIVAEIDIDESLLSPELAKQMAAVTGGHIFKRNSNIIEEWSLDDLALTAFPADKRLPKLVQTS